MRRRALSELHRLLRCRRLRVARENMHAPIITHAFTNAYMSVMSRSRARGGARRACDLRPTLQICTAICKDVTHLRVVDTFARVRRSRTARTRCSRHARALRLAPCVSGALVLAPRRHESSSDEEDNDYKSRHARKSSSPASGRVRDITHLRSSIDPRCVSGRRVSKARVGGRMRVARECAGTSPHVPTLHGANDVLWNGQVRARTRAHVWSACT